MTKTYIQLAREIATLQAAAEKQLTAEKKEAVARLNEVIAKYDLSAADLKFPDTGTSVAKPGPKVKSTSKSAVSGAKYADGTGNTWGGRGPRPAWLRNAMAVGRSLESFSVSVATAAVPISAPAAGSAVAVGSTKRAGFTVAPKYRHPGSGDTWSGRGSAPRWLKEALRKRGTKLDDFLIAKPAATDSSDSPSKAAKSGTASKPKVAASTPSLRKPVVSTKVAPEKARAAKKAVASKSSPKNAPAAKKTSLGAAIAASGVKKAATKKSTKALPLPPAVQPKKKPAATKQAAAAPQRAATKATATSAKPARKAVATKKTSAATSAPAVDAVVPPEAVPSVSSPASETPVNVPVV